MAIIFLFYMPHFKKFPPVFFNEKTSVKMRTLSPRKRSILNYYGNH